MVKRKNKLSRRRIVTFGTLSIISIIWFLSTLITYTMNIKNLKNEKNSLDNQLIELKEDAENLKTEIEKLKDPEYIARYARKEYSYSKNSGEYIIKIEKDLPVVLEVTKKNNSSSMYPIIGIGIVLLLIIIYIIRKKPSQT